MFASYSYLLFAALCQFTTTSITHHVFTIQQLQLYGGDRSYPWYVSCSQRLVHITDVQKDPWLIQKNGRYFLTFTAGDRLEIWSASNLDGLRNPQKSVVW